MTNPPATGPEPRPFLVRLARTWALPAILGVGIALAWIKFVSPTSGSAEFAAEPKPSPIQGDRAYGYLKSLCDFGPRIAGSEANTRQRNYVAAHWKKLGATLREQKFATRHPLTGKRVEMINLIGSWWPEREERLVLGAHYDTRPFPDMEPDPADRRQPFLGANDGASGVAMLMEIAHHLTKDATPWGVDLVIFDGEELIYEDDDGRHGDFFLGSNEFSRLYKADRKKGSYRYVAGIVLDMIADKELALPVEVNSNRFAPSLVREMWGVADRLKSTAFVQNLGTEVMDDHLSMNSAGIPTIDIIDFDYPYWHRAGDVPEQCSGQSLQEVGRVVTAWMSLPKAARSKKR